MYSLETDPLNTDAEHKPAVPPLILYTPINSPAARNSSESQGKGNI